MNFDNEGVAHWMGSHAYTTKQPAPVARVLRLPLKAGRESGSRAFVKKIQFVEQKTSILLWSKAYLVLTYAL